PTLSRHHCALLFSHLQFVSTAPPHPPHLHSFPTRRSSDLPLPSDRDASISGPPRWFCGDRVTGAPSLRLPACSGKAAPPAPPPRSEEHTSELQSHLNLVCRLLLEKKKHKQDDMDD